MADAEGPLFALSVENESVSVLGPSFPDRIEELGAFDFDFVMTKEDGSPGKVVDLGETFHVSSVELSKQEGGPFFCAICDSFKKQPDSKPVSF